MNEFFNQVQIMMGDTIYHVIFCSDEIDDSVFHSLNEGKKIDIGSGYYCHKHAAHSVVGKKHVELYYKNNKLCAVNYDGTGHDGSSGMRIPNKPYKFLKYTLGLQLRDDQLIEQLNYEDMYELEQFMAYRLLVESVADPDDVRTVLYVECV